VSQSTQSFDYKRIYPVLKWIFSIVSIYFFVAQVQKMEAGVLSEIGTQLAQKPLLTALVFALALVNWNAEAQKFKLLIRSEIELSNFQAFLTILGGMAISNFTPARTGEYIGRGLLLKKLHPIKVVIATVTGNIAQVLMTYGLGIICLVIMAIFGDYDYIWQEFSKMWVVVTMLLVLLLLIVYIRQLLRWLKPRLPKPIAKAFKLIKKYDRAVFARVVGIAFVRYLAFASQFYLLLQLFSDFALPAFAIALVPIAYLMQSLAPVPAISDIGVRVFVTTLLFGSFLSDNPILQAVTCLWFINLILPGLVGTVYLVISTIRNR
jgi:hypothetical protein